MIDSKIKEYDELLEVLRIEIELFKSKIFNSNLLIDELVFRIELLEKRA